MPEQEWFTVVEVAKMLKVSRDTITRRFENEPGVIHSTRLIRERTC